MAGAYAFGGALPYVTSLAFHPTAKVSTPIAGGLPVCKVKTGGADPDLRQAEVYLLACSYLFPDRNVGAYFYNLETMTSSELITTNVARLTETAAKLAQIAKLHQQQLRDYRLDPTCFDRLFPAHPGSHCRYCPFNYRCDYATTT